MPDLNLVQLMGRLTSDPELRHISSGTAVTELRMAVNKTWSNKDGDKKEEVLYVDVTYWGKTAEIVCQYLRKGSSVYVQGSLKMDTWDDKTTGEKRSKIRVSGDTFQFLDSKPRDGGGGNQGQSQQQQPAQSRGGSPQGRGGPAQGRGPAQGQRRPDPPVEDFDDPSIPF